MQDDDLVQIYMTADSEDVAVHIATTLVNEGLIACANLSGDTRSIYRWNDVIQLDREVTVVMKTIKARVDDVIARAAELHTYDVPCILVQPVTGGYEPYIKWVREQAGLVTADS